MARELLKSGERAILPERVSLSELLRFPIFGWPTKQRVHGLGQSPWGELCQNVVPHPSAMIYKKVGIFDSTLSSRKVVPHPSSMIYEKVGIFDSTLSSRNVVPHPSGMIYEKVGIFDSTLSSRNVVPHPSGMIHKKSRQF